MELAVILVSEKSDISKYAFLRRSTARWRRRWDEQSSCSSPNSTTPLAPPLHRRRPPSPPPLSPDGRPAFPSLPQQCPQVLGQLLQASPRQGYTTRLAQKALSLFFLFPFSSLREFPMEKRMLMMLEFCSFSRIGITWRRIGANTSLVMLGRQMARRSF